MTINRRSDSLPPHETLGLTLFKSDFGNNQLNARIFVHTADSRATQSTLCRHKQPAASSI